MQPAFVPEDIQCCIQRDREIERFLHDEAFTLLKVRKETGAPGVTPELP